MSGFEGSTDATFRDNLMISEGSRPWVWLSFISGKSIWPVQCSIHTIIATSAWKIMEK